MLLYDRYLDNPPTRRLDVIVPSPLSYPYGMTPRSMDEYRSGPGRWPRIVGILPAGTPIGLGRIEHHGYPGLEDWCEITGTIESGEFLGREVDLALVSSGVAGSRMWRLNPEELGPESADGADATRGIEDSGTPEP